MIDLVLRGVVRLMEPMGFLWAMLLVLSFFAFRRHQRRLAGALVALAGFLWILGATPLPGKLLGTLEQPWVGVKRADLPTADVIVLLGGFSAPSREEVGRLHFNMSSDRAVTALELVRLGKARTLVIGGNSITVDGENFTEADLLRDLLRTWAPAGLDIISLGGSKHTRHEAEKVARLAAEHGWKRVLLVTSASHLRRATGVFRTTTKLEIVPVPSAFLTGVSIVTTDSFDLIPRSTGLSKVEGWLHEQIGWRMYRWRGWISDEAAAR